MKTTCFIKQSRQNIENFKVLYSVRKRSKLVEIFMTIKLNLFQKYVDILIHF